MEAAVAVRGGGVRRDSGRSVLLFVVFPGAARPRVRKIVQDRVLPVRDAARIVRRVRGAQRNGACRRRRTARQRRPGRLRRRRRPGRAGRAGSGRRVSRAAFPPKKTTLRTVFFLPRGSHGAGTAEALAVAGFAGGSRRTGSGRRAGGRALRSGFLLPFGFFAA